ncbi:MAG: FtsK/SpoIIIE domain-containing protein, partial [Bacteroidota bacterium]
VHGRKIDINSDEPARLIEKHCRHGFKILEERFSQTSVNILDFFLSELPHLSNTSGEPENGLDMQLVPEKDDLAEKIFTAFLETHIAVEYLGYRKFLRNTKYFFEVRNLNHNKEILDEITTSNLELQTGLHHKLYLAPTHRERTFSVNIIHDQIDPIPVSEYIYDTAPDDYTLMIGLDDQDQIFSIKLQDMPHLLIGGTTGSGKTVFLKTLVYQMVNKHLDLVIIDQKGGNTFNQYAAHDSVRLVKTSKQTDEVISRLVNDMEKRYQDKKARLARPIVLVIDEFADLVMQNKKLEPFLIRLAQKGREARIHLILATQRPDAKILEGLLRSNLPSRIAFKVQKATESRIILDDAGAEKLRHKGEMIFNNIKFRKRLQSFYIED